MKARVAPVADRSFEENRNSAPGGGGKEEGGGRGTARPRGDAGRCAGRNSSGGERRLARAASLTCRLIDPRGFTDGASVKMRGGLPAFWKVIPRGGSASAFNYTPDASAKTDTIVHYAATIWRACTRALAALGGSSLKLPTCTRRSS